MMALLARIARIGTLLSLLLCAACGSPDLPPGMQALVIRVSQIPTNTVNGSVARVRQIQFAINGKDVLNPQASPSSPLFPVGEGKQSHAHQQRFVASQQGQVQVQVQVTLDGCVQSSGTATATLAGKDGATVEVSITLAERPEAEGCRSECGPGDFCWASPRPRGNNFNAVHMLSAREGWAVGDRGQVVHFTGSDPADPGSWRLDVQAEALAKGYDLLGVWGSADGKSVWAVGYDLLVGPDWDKQSILLHFDGQSWRSLVLPSTELAKGSAVWGSDQNNVWAVGSKICALRALGDGLHADCKAPLSNETMWLNALHGTSAEKLWAVGTGTGGVIRLENDQWKKVSSPLGLANLQSVWVISDDDVRVVGTGGDILRCSSQNGCSKISLNNSSARGIWGYGTTVWFSAGTTIYRWPAMSAPVTVGQISRIAIGQFNNWSLSGVPGDANPSIVAVGIAGTIALAKSSSLQDEQKFPYPLMKSVAGDDKNINLIRGWGGQGWMSIYRPGVAEPYMTEGFTDNPTSRVSEKVDGLIWGSLRDMWTSPSGKYVYAASENQILRRSKKGGSWSVISKGDSSLVYYRISGVRTEAGRTVVVASGWSTSGPSGEFLRLEDAEDGSTLTRYAVPLANGPYCVGAGPQAGQQRLWLVTPASGQKANLYSFAPEDQAPQPGASALQDQVDYPSAVICRLSFAPSGEGWLSAQTNMTAHLSPGGNRWLPPTNPTRENSIWDAWLRPAPFNDIWALGRFGRVFCKPLDDGKSVFQWQQVESSATGDDLQSLWADENGTVWIGGAGGSLLRLRNDSKARQGCPKSN